jgi:NAD(P)-dependent dehydrogenase (short-subunit alcohol dehydrogenase family)
MKDRKVIFVTGTSRGLGKQIFEMLTHQGHSVYGASRYAKKAKNEFAIDVTDALQCQRAIEQIVAKEGRIDVVITNVGGHLIGAAMEVSSQELKSQIDLNFYSAVNVIKSVLPIFIKQKQGRIISISSLMGITALPYSSAYCSAKFALEGYLEALRLELLPLGIYVSLTETGYINTGIKISLPENNHPHFSKVRLGIKKLMEEKSPSGIDPMIVANKIAKIIQEGKPKFRHKIDRMTKTLALFKALANESFYEVSILKTFHLPKSTQIL